MTSWMTYKGLELPDSSVGEAGDNLSADIQALADGFDALDASKVTTGILGVSHGGTGLSALTATRIPYATATNTLGTSPNLTYDGSILAVGNGSGSGTFAFTGIGYVAQYLGNGNIGFANNELCVTAFATTLVRIMSAGHYGWTASTSTAAMDTSFARASAGAVRVANGSTGAGTLRIASSTTTHTELGSDGSASFNAQGNDADFRIGGDTDANCFLLDAGQDAVSIGSASVAASAKLQVVSTTKGFLPPVMTSTQKSAIGSPTAGLIVYDSTLNKLCVYTGSNWETISSS